MTRGLYEQIGVVPDADLDEIKAAYGRSVAHVLRRREATVSQGGDTATLDLSRDQLDEAWAILSDPARRRRYDAMLAVAGEGLAEAPIDDLWPHVAGSMIHPSVAAAARIVDAATSLPLAPLPEPARLGPARRVSEPVADDAPTSPLGVGRAAGAFGPPRPVSRGGRSADVVALHPDRPGLRMVETRESDAAVVDLARHTTPGHQGPPTTPTTVPTSAHDVDQLVDQLGYGGALLGAIREDQGLTLDRMSEVTRISVRYLEAVEREDFAALPPAPAFVRGYVREMARMLGLDVERVVSGYMRRFSADG